MIILKYLYWVACLAWWKWARREMRVTHPDYIEVHFAIMRYEALLGIGRTRNRRLHTPKHWNCRCAPQPLQMRSDVGVDFDGGDA